MSIKVITEPTIYLVGSQYERWHGDGGIGEFLTDIEAEDWSSDANHAAELLPEVAGRLCYMSYSSPRPGGNKKYLEHILEVGHGSVLEHAVFNFIITGVSRSFTHELVRHRAGFGFSQLSQRYVDESDVAFVVPPALLPHKAEYDSSPDAMSDDVIAYMAWAKSCEDSLVAYSLISDNLEHRDFFAGREGDKTARRKAAREAARSVLPNCTETKIFVTANARALRHFIELRGNPAADAEIRRVAVALLRILQSAAPNLFGDYSIEPCPLGGEMASTPHRKV